jgi:hypothetical protein
MLLRLAWRRVTQIVSVTITATCTSAGTRHRAARGARAAAVLSLFHPVNLHTIHNSTTGTRTC